MMIKICGLRDTANMDCLKAIAPDFIGLIFYSRSPRFVGNEVIFREYVRAINWAHKVGVFVDAPPAEVCRTAARYGLDFVQLHGKETPASCKVIAAEVKIIKTLAVGPSLDFDVVDRYRSYCTYLLLDTASRGYGGTGRQFDWAILNDSRLDHPFFLSGGIGPEDVDRIRMLSHPGLAGIDINSRFEIRPGIKNKTLTQKFIHEIRYQ